MEYKEEKYNLSKEYCANIEDHTNDTIYDDIENEVELLFVIRDKINRCRLDHNFLVSFNRWSISTMQNH